MSETPRRKPTSSIYEFEEDEQTARLRERVLNAAYTLIEVSGKCDLTFEDLARVTDEAPEAVAALFRDEHRLIEEVVRREIRTLGERLDAVPVTAREHGHAETGPVTDEAPIEALVRTTLGFFAQRAAFITAVGAAPERFEAFLGLIDIATARFAMRLEEAMGFPREESGPGVVLITLHMGAQFVINFAVSSRSIRTGCGLTRSTRRSLSGSARSAGSIRRGTPDFGQ